MKSIYCSILLALFCSLFLSCSDIKKDSKGREDFSIFINKFYSDIDFQLSRIEFPVSGGKLENGKNEIIEKEDWIILKPVDQNNPDYEVKNIEITDDLIEQKIIVKKSFIIKLQFSLNRVTKLWYLSSYPGVTGASVDSKSEIEENSENPVTVTPDSTYE
jgi:hypothetical protein